jgi:hypothetical protein
MKLPFIRAFFIFILLAQAVNSSAEYAIIDDGACNAATGLTTNGHKCGVVGQIIQPSVNTGNGQNTNNFTQGYNAGYAKGYSDAQRSCGNNSSSTNPPPILIPAPAQNPTSTASPTSGVAGVDSCVSVIRNSRNEAVLKNVCSYIIYIWACFQGGSNLWPYNSGEKINSYATGNISYAACKTGHPYVPNTKTQFNSHVTSQLDNSVHHLMFANKICITPIKFPLCA